MQSYQTLIDSLLLKDFQTLIDSLLLKDFQTLIDSLLLKDFLMMQNREDFNQWEIPLTHCILVDSSTVIWTRGVKSIL